MSGNRFAGPAVPAVPAVRTGPRLLTGGFPGAPTSLHDHLARHNPLLTRLCRSSADALIEEVRLAGLTGRGGAAFPAARKLASVAAAGGRPVVVANGTEGEPASAKDKVLAATEPHLVLDGAVIAAAMVGARKAYIVVDPVVVATMEFAVAERVAARLDRVRLRVVPAADGFVAGEASAVVNWIERGVPAPRSTPPRLAERGLHGQPTLVNNIETLAQIALIARYGARWFRSAGTQAEPGTMLVTLTGAVRTEGVREIEIGRPVRDVLALAGGLSVPVSALLLGGYSGAWVRWPDVADLPFSAAGLAGVHAGPGAGLIAALPADRCPLVETAAIARYLAGESAGQCGPCLFGLGAISAELTSLAAGRPSSPDLIRRWLGQVDGRGACRHPDGAARMIRSALSVFAAEVSEHLGGWCTGPSSFPVLPFPYRRPA
ncbi:MAG TPA: NADH-ubiquinone oxidoreductase-F iron-sulfur binding region domain-containing protein [Streptosporangiaceae bacterium]|nr:NADH-ubiquinone oxidoreductase-F iron-sulfur binding region domain-containing protein [Streptosporangiaceae bacterium]